MYLRRCGQTRANKDNIYWELVESYRTQRGPRQRVVAYLGDIAQSTGLGIKQAATDQVGSWQSRLFDDGGEPEWVEVDTKRVRVEGVRDLGGCWLGLEISERLDLIPLLEALPLEGLPQGREDIPWSFQGKDGHDAGPDAPL